MPMGGPSDPAGRGVRRILLTASGGPFRTRELSTLGSVTPDEACAHPKWVMGRKISVDSATMMNKGLEIIEACWLFDTGQDKIEVVVHPQSIIHSMVEFNDGSIKAQMGLPDMKLPIHYAFFYPERIKTTFKRMSFKEINNLTFEEPDLETFRNLGLAYEAMKIGGNKACILNAANEITVEAFLQDKIKFLQIAEINEATMNKVAFIKKPTLNDYIDTNKEAREVAQSLIK
jgi:1-deoxy-D-xylulose-5-phosphate reductoisomerase